MATVADYFGGFVKRKVLIPIIVEWFKTEKEARAFVTKTFGEYSNRRYRNVLMWTRPKRTKAKKRKD